MSSKMKLAMAVAVCELQRKQGDPSDDYSTIIKRVSESYSIHPVELEAAWTEYLDMLAKHGGFQ